MKEAVWRLSADSIHKALLELLMRFGLVFLIIIPFLAEKPFVLFLDNESLLKQILRLLLIAYFPFFIFGFIKNTCIVINNVFFHTDRIIAYTDAQGFHFITGRKFVIHFSTGLGKRYPDYHIAWQDIRRFSHCLDEGGRYALPDRFIFNVKGKLESEIYLDHFGDANLVKHITEVVVARHERGKITYYQSPILKVSRLAWQILCLNFFILLTACIVHLIGLIHPYLFIAIFIALLLLTACIPAEKFCHVVS